ncbi:MAG: BREX-1 system adenine-specific DNA-methyltransferase PglX [Melioribacteraceae bacterium]|nr:BREX-1 system adenine-specific DNA-methyltransferase PglX [Melioribacteraceae bacterium]
MNLSIFNTTNLFEAATDLFQQLGIKLNSNTALPIPTKDILKEHYRNNDTFNAIDKTYFIGIIEDSVFQNTLFEEKYNAQNALQHAEKNYNGLMLFALELTKQPTRTEISEITRVFNRISQKMPVALVLKYFVENEAVISISISERFKFLQNWRQGEKAGKVIILRDIRTQNPHTGHLLILKDLQNHNALDFNQLHQHWLQILDVSILNKKFFKEISNWYFSALNKVSFPDDLEKNKEIRNATNLIRLITRIIFIWFIKEKKLVPASLFNKDFLREILKDFNKNEKSHNYYNAILQNLFFATLNQKIKNRKFTKDGDIKTNKEEYGVKNLFRYADLFTISEKEVLDLFKDIPFLNGGLFDCLDKPDEDGKIEYVDGFSRNPKKRAIVPDYIFFSEEKEVDLNEVYGTKNKQYISRGLINILQSYKFTVAENTPIEEEIALDPELLGKVFENLLASYNPETKTTARKQTGSFYTPREIVNYMVDNSIIAYLKQQIISKPNGKIELGSQQVDMFGNDARVGQLKLETPVEPNRWKDKEKILEKNLRKLLSYETDQPFDNTEDVKNIIFYIYNCKILDPACGSGAFPMGILQKMVHILKKLDPENIFWRELQRKKAIDETQSAFNIGNKEERAKRLAEINDVFENNSSDYGRKLYLIENCIYGIDIQPIAVQIAKLRFFISLVIDQKVDKSKENFGVRSLPNLETKFVAANALIGLDKPEQTTLRNPEIESKENELKELRHKYFTASTRKEKISLQKQDKKLRLEIAKMLQKDGWDNKVAEQIASFDPYDQNHFADWFDPEWMFGIIVSESSGFDIVIGNPPYIQLQKDSGRLSKLYQNQKYKTFASTGDIYTLFYEKGMNLLKLNGHLCYITSNKWMRAGYGEKLRQYFSELKPILLIDLGPGVFENATVDTNILLVQKNFNKTHKLIALTLQKQNGEVDISAQVEKNSVVLNKLNKDAWFIGSSAEQQLKEKIERIGKPLKEWDVNIYRGVLTGLNEAFIITTEKRNEILTNCKDEEERRHTEAIIKPILRGRDIKRYYYDWAGLWVIGTFPALKLNIEDYPALKKYFLDNFDIRQLEQSGKKYPKLGFDARKKTGNKWFETQDQIVYYPEFEKEKVVWTPVNSEYSFTILPKGIYFNNSIFMITGINVKYFCGLFNSKIIRYYLTFLFSSEENYTYASKVNMENIPLSPITSSNQPIVSQIESLVDQILAAKKPASASSASTPQTDISHWEREIDILVYKLYNLTYEEVKIIDPAIEQTISKEEYEKLNIN